MLNKLQELRKDRKAGEGGFTIIEVMIVLAIAGLIMLIVFLAIPALQRNSRNTQRKNDAGAISGAIGEFISNANGASVSTGDIVSGSGSSAGYGDALKNAKLGYYTASSLTSSAVTSGTTTTSVSADAEKVTVLLNAKCLDTGQATYANRGVAVVYAVETGGGTPKIQCTQA